MQEDKGDFFSKKKEEYLMKMQQRGFDLFQMQDFLENRGMISLDDYLLSDNLMNPNYVNPLKYFPQMQPQQQVNYGYNPQANMPPQGMPMQQ